MTTPLFLLSLPRSGSTLLQRLIATHPSVATVSEPWVMLPQFLGYREGHVFATYRQRYQAQAFSEFLDQLPDGTEAHRTAIRRFADTLYSAACSPNQTHFLDKTPRYHLIVDDLLRTFPEGRFVLLWRNPLAVAASCIETWGRGKWNLDQCRVDLHHGLSNLIEAREQHGDRLLTIRYEDLVTDPTRHLPSVFAHLGLTPVIDAPERYAEVVVDGTMGDKKGDAHYTGVTTASRDAWATVLASPPRRAWARRYLHWLGRHRLAVMGYDMDDLLQQLAEPPLRLRSTFSDLARMAYGHYAVTRETALLRRKRDLKRRDTGAGRGGAGDIDVACE